MYTYPRYGWLELMEATLIVIMDRMHWQRRDGNEWNWTEKLHTITYWRVELLITALRRAERLSDERSRKRHQETGTPAGPGAR